MRASSAALPVGVPRYSQSGDGWRWSKAGPGTGIDGSALCRRPAKRVRVGVGRAKVDRAEIGFAEAEDLDVALGTDPENVWCVVQPVRQAAHAATNRNFSMRNGRAT